MEPETSEIASNGNTRNWVSVCFVFRFEFWEEWGSEDILFWEMGFLQTWILIFDFPSAQENKFSTAALLILFWFVGSFGHLQSSFIFPDDLTYLTESSGCNVVSHGKWICKGEIALECLNFSATSSEKLGKLIPSSSQAILNS